MTTVKTLPRTLLMIYNSQMWTNASQSPIKLFQKLGLKPWHFNNF